MSPSVQADQKTKQFQQTNISLVESVAKHKRHILLLERLVNWSFIGLEYFLYLLVFILLYANKVNPDFSLELVLDSFKSNGHFDEYLFLLVIIFVVYSILLIDKGLFKLYSGSSLIDEVFKIIKAVFISFMIAIGILFLMKTSMIYSRVIIVSFFFSVIAIATLVRLVKHMVVSKFKNSHLFSKNVLIVGAGKVGNQIGNYLSVNRSNGYKVVGYLDDHKQNNDILGDLNDLELIIQREKVNEIFITIPSERALINRLLSSIRKYDIEIKIVPELFDFVSSTIKFQTKDAYPYLEIVRTPLRGLNLFLKRLVDITLSSVGIIIISPVLVLTALMIKIDSKGPIIFKQKRIGKNGVTFHMYKFRSMVSNAELLKKELEKLNEAEGPVFKIKNDPRITRVGAFIRKYSIDELPQLFNVLIGNMSLIGPRPPLPKEVEQYDDYQWRRLEVRPGISGLWQVSGRSDLSFDEWVNLDIYYIENWSIPLDIKILLKTFPAVMKGSGAY